jgi:hypothetical protein
MKHCTIASLGAECDTVRFSCTSMALLLLYDIEQNIIGRDIKIGI